MAPLFVVPLDFANSRLVMAEGATQPDHWEVQGAFTRQPKGKLGEPCLLMQLDAAASLSLSQTVSGLTSGTKYRVRIAVYDVVGQWDGVATMDLDVDGLVVQRNVSTAGYHDAFLEFTATAAARHAIRIRFTAPKPVKLELYGFELVPEERFGTILGWATGEGQSVVV
jgi:hypothetical protein